MANIIVTATPVDVNVSTTLSNIVVTDLESNNTVNVSTTLSNVSVTSTPVNVTISPSIGVSNAEIRAALSNTSPIIYDNNTGVIGFDPSSNNMQVLSLSTTNDVTASGNVNGDGLVITNNATISGTLDVANITIGGDLSANLKDISLSYYDAGNVSGNVTLDVADGPVQKIRLTNNLTGLSFTGATAAQPITLIIQQDNVGFWTLDTTTHASNWTDWLFTSNFKTLSTTANASDLLSITYNGTNYFASLVNFVQTLITNAELANSNVIVNGTTISLGSSGNISHLGNLTTTALPEGTNLYFTAARVRGNVSAATPITYNSATGEFGFADFAQIGGLNVNSTQAYAGVSLRVNKYLGGGSPNAMEVFGNTSIAENLYVGTDLTVTGNIQGAYILGNGAFLTGVTSLTNAQVIAHIATVPLTVGGNLTVNGNINATGNINVQNVEDLYVRDQTIVMNANAASPANVQIVSNRPGFANTEIKWNEQTDRWSFTNDGSTYYNLATSTSDVAEGTNLYYTTDRANTAIGAYQGDINTIGTVTAATANATTVNVTDLNATNNVTVLGKINAADGSNIAYVRAFSADLVTDSGSNGLNVVLESQSNNRLAKASSDSIRYVPDTRTLLVTDGTIGASAANTSFSGVNLFLTGNINAAFGNLAVGNISVNTVTAGSLSGNGTLITAITGANVFGLVSTQVSEGTNLYYTTDRANTAIGAYQGDISTPGNITAGNVITASIHSNGSSDVTINSNTAVVLKETIKGVSTNVGNISGDGYAPFGTITNMFTNLSAGDLNSFLITAGNTTSGNATITGVTVAERVGTGTAAATLANITQYYSFNQTFGTGGFLATYPFGPGTYVQSVDAANNTITMSQPAAATFDFGTLSGTARSALMPAAYDPGTQLLIRMLSQRAVTGGGSASTILGSGLMNIGTYGYPLTGPVAADFVYSVGDSSNYTVTSAFTNKMNARTSITAPSTVFQAPRGMIVGSGDLTNRAENDNFPAFGINVLWDGLGNVTTDYAGNTPITQVLLKQYSDNTLASANPERGGPRIFFTAARGNKNSPFQTTNLLKNSELGRIAWWAPTDTNAGLSSLAAPAYINAIANRDMTGSHNGGIGLYLVASPHTDAGSRGVAFAHELGNTLVASHANTTTGAMQPITFAPMYWDTALATAANSSSLYNLTVSADNYQWATVNHDDAVNYTGSKLSITNGVSNVADFNGNLTLSLDRNDNGAGFGNKEWAFKLQPGSNSLVLTEDDVVRTTFAGGNVTATAFYGDGSNLTNITVFDNIVVAGQSNVVASGSSNLTLVAGSGMVITTDAGTDTITFASTGGYGNAEVAAFLADYGSNTVVTSGNITASNFIGNVDGTTGDFSGTVTATEFVGGGSDLTDVRAKTVELTVKNISGANIAKGYPLHVVSATGGGTPEVVLADAGNAALMPAHYIAGEDLAIDAEGRGIVSGEIRGINTSSFLIGEVIFVAVGGGYSNVAPSGESNIIQNLGIVSRVDAVNGGGEIFGAGRGAATPALNTGNVFIGGAGNVTVTKPLTTAITDANVKLKQFAETVVSLGNVSGDISSNIDVANGTIYQLTATGGITINSLANAAAGTSATLIVTQDGTGGHTLTSTMLFAGGSKTLSTAANSIDIISVFYDGSTYYATLSKGYA